MTANALAAFSPATRAWFAATLGEPTPPQAQGWPAIQRGEHTLILAPTGSGKTLTAFLWGIDALYRDTDTSGIRLLYISPLKALNNDIERNLRAPIEGIRAQAAQIGQRMPELRVAVRTGDTPAAARAQMLKSPPDILITTPESLYLMLTSLRARALFRGVRTVIVDEIHTLCGNKRGVHLALSLERLQAIAQQPVQRIGLSATVRPPEVAAHFLGGNDRARDFQARPVTIVDAHYKKSLDLEVITAVEDFRELPASSIWPSVIPRVLADMYRHRSTLIFANNRRLAERTADRLNAQLEAVRDERIEPDSLEVLAPEGIARDRGMFAIGAEGPIRAHHGSMSKEARRQMEEDLKAGKLPALVGTSSLELGIDIGAVDLVVQLQSPKSVAQGLQRVGRSGHMVGQTSRGRIYATFREDLVEAAAIVRGMLDGDVEHTAMPQNALDVLAQQIVAMVANEDWHTDALFDLVRGAAPYQRLTRASFEQVLDMLSGKYFFDAAGVRAASSLRAKIAYDRVNNRLGALPGSRMLAIGNAGTIPDTGQFGAYLSDGKTKIGDLEEEFVFETRVGDAFLLGSKVWRVSEITNDRVIVTDAAGATPRMPFWNGDYPHRPYELGARIGAFRREVMEQLDALPAGAVAEWLKRDYHLDDNSAANLIDHFQRQRDAVGVMSSDRQIVVEQFLNDVGDPYLVIQSPFGGRVNGAWAIALASVLTEQTGVTPEMQAHDDGIIFRLRETGLDAARLVRALSADNARERILRELPASAVFGAQFRMNAGRALLLPRQRGVKRTPFWLQRLRAKDLLALTLKSGDFPIVTETYRDCLRDVFDMPHLEGVLNAIADQTIAVAAINTVTPSPIAAGLLFNFTAQFLYEWDAPKAERQLQALSLPRQALADALNGTELGELLRPEAIEDVSQRAQHRAAGTRARSAEELALLLQELGDLSSAEISERCVDTDTDAGADWIAALSAQTRIFAMDIAGESRWVAAELVHDYAQPLWHDAGCAGRVLRRFLRQAGPVTRERVQTRYGFDPGWLDSALAALIDTREVLDGVPAAGQLIDAEAYARMHRQTLTILRREVQAAPFERYADFLARWQGAHPDAQSADASACLRQLRGLCLPASVWINDALPARLEAARQHGGWPVLKAAEGLAWCCAGGDARRPRLRVFPRGEGALFVPASGDAELAPLGARERAVLDFLRGEGASFVSDVEIGLRMSAADAAAALETLARAGLATNDSVDALQALIDGAPAAQRVAPPQPRSGLEADLAQRLGASPDRPLSRSRYREAKRKVRERMAQEKPAATTAAAAPLATVASRWSAVHRAGILGPPLGGEALAEAVARVLLERYGIVARECLAHEEINADWASIYRCFDRLEMRGEVRRGYFVDGLSGLQFALPQAVEQLRGTHADGSVVLLNAQDPANLYGGARFARLPGTHLALLDGALLALFEDGGARITTADNAAPAALSRALAAYFGRVNAPRRAAISSWNNADVSDSEGAPLLRALGFERTPTGMEKWI